jgi:hypothetical protein
MTDGNKAIKHKDTLLRQAEDKITQLSNFIKQFSQLSDGKTLSLDAIKSAISCQPATLVISSGNCNPAGNPEQSLESRFNALKTKIEQGDAETIAQMDDVSSSKRHGFTFKPEVNLDDEMDELEAMEGEVLDGEEDPELIKTNKLLHMAKTFNNPSSSVPGSKQKIGSAQQSKAKE